MGDWEQKNQLINELAEGRELAMQLQSHLNLPCSPNETQQVLVQKILASYEKAISVLNCSTVGTSSTPLGAAAIGFSESPPSINGSPKSDQDSDPEHRNTGLRNRKSMPRWTKQVRVDPGMGLEGPLEDGFSWRKYGQKDILGARHPRGYYRCTHRHVRGCLATKQVQRSDEDSTILEVTYRGRHTCNQSSNNSSIPSTLSAAAAPPDQTHQEPTHHQPQPNQSEEQLLMNYFRTGLKVLTDDLDTTHQDHTPIFPSFHFPSTSNAVINNPENQFCPVQNNLAANFPPSFLSPATSGTNYFSVPASELNTSYQNFQSCEADQFTDIISSSAATSATNSPTVGMGLDSQLGNAEFDTHFTFNHPGFFS